MGTHLIESPLFVLKSSGQKYALNLNIFRNAHYQTTNKAKHRYKELMTSRILELPELSRIRLRLTVYPPTRRLFDVGNVCSVVEKFFLDALVELGRIKDDNYLYVPSIEYCFGAVCKEHPRVDIEIIEL